MLGHAEQTPCKASYHPGLLSSSVRPFKLQLHLCDRSLPVGLFARPHVQGVRPAGKFANCRILAGHAEAGPSEQRLCHEALHASSWASSASDMSFAEKSDFSVDLPPNSCRKIGSTPCARLSGFRAFSKLKKVWRAWRTQLGFCGCFDVSPGSILLMVPRQQSVEPLRQCARLH